MCTLSIFTSENQTIVTMNRDEVRNRYESNIIQHASIENTHIFYPVDKRSNGTWFGFNNHGIVLSLLNRYHESQRENATSRGGIIPFLLRFENLQEIEKAINTFIENRYNPFDLICTNTSQVIKFSWNGTSLSKQNTSNLQSHMFSSSSIDTVSVLKKRAVIFTKFKNSVVTTTNKAAYILNKLHLQQDSNDCSSSILMSRPETHTKSISQIIMNNRALNYYYFDEIHMKNITNTHPYSKCHQKKLKLKS